MGNFKVRDLKVREFKVRDFKVRDFNLKSLTLKFLTWEILKWGFLKWETLKWAIFASGLNPKIPHFAIVFLKIPQLQCNPCNLVLEGKSMWSIYWHENLYLRLKLTAFWDANVPRGIWGLSFEIWYPKSDILSSKYKKLTKLFLRDFWGLFV